jgi:competence protein ComEC
MSPLPLFNSFKQRIMALLFLFFLFLFSVFIEFYHYQKIVTSEVYKTDASIQNIYCKPKYTVLKLQADDFTFFTSVPKESSYQKLQQLQIFFLTTKITFLEYLKGFYTHSFHIQAYPMRSSLKNALYDLIIDQHQNKTIASLYTALFLATNITPTLREFTTHYGIAHLIAISGFHLSVLSAVLYFILHILYKPIHKKYFPYRNKRFDILMVTAIFLFGYLLLLDFVPSLLRAFVMLIFGLVLLRSNIKLLSFDTLFIIVLIILALFPKLLFSLSLWFSVAGVFYIFLFLQYFKSYNKYFQIIFFNIWIFLAINPIVHYFFLATSFEQLYSPLITIAFTLFYPVVALLHLINFGDLFDSLLINWQTIEVFSFEKNTSLWFFIVYLMVSLLAIFEKRAFAALHILMVGFTIYMFF